MVAVVERLLPLRRSLTGEGVRRTLDVLGEIVPFERIRVPSGTRCFDWTVPDEWTIREAYIEDPSGARIVDLDRSSLHVVSYSRPIDAVMDIAELRPHLYSLPDRPRAIPYRTTYYRDDWGFCLADEQLRSLGPGSYRVRIDATLAPGHLDLALAALGPEGAPEILFTSYVCHPAMANNELSGPVILALLYRALSGVAGLRHRYRFLLGPETIGALAFLAREGDRLKERLVAGYVLTCIGDDGPYTYKRSRRGDSAGDRAAVHAIAHAADGRETKIMDFDPSDGSDERQYCSPGFDLPMGNLARSIYGTFPEYHTSLDDLRVVTASGLAGSLAAALRVAQTLELSRRLVRTEPRGEPQLGRRGLYPTIGGAGQIDREVRRLLHLLNWSDGHDDLTRIADRLGEPVWDLAVAAGRLMDADLLRDAGSA